MIFSAVFFCMILKIKRAEVIATANIQTGWGIAARTAVRMDVNNKVENPNPAGFGLQPEGNYYAPEMNNGVGEGNYNYGPEMNGAEIITHYYGGSLCSACTAQPSVLNFCQIRTNWALKKSRSKYRSKGLL